MLLVLVGACAAILAMKLLTPVKSPADATRDYLSALKTGDTTTAFALLCRPGRAKLTRAKFAEGIQEPGREIAQSVDLEQVVAASQVGEMLNLGDCPAADDANLQTSHRSPPASAEPAPR